MTATQRAEHEPAVDVDGCRGRGRVFDRMRRVRPARARPRASDALTGPAVTGRSASARVRPSPGRGPAARTNTASSASTTVPSGITHASSRPAPSSAALEAGSCLLVEAVGEVDQRPQRAAGTAGARRRCGTAAARAVGSSCADSRACSAASGSRSAASAARSAVSAAQLAAQRLLGGAGAVGHQLTGRRVRPARRRARSDRAARSANASSTGSCSRLASHASSRSSRSARTASSRSAACARSAWRSRWRASASLEPLARGGDAPARPTRTRASARAIASIASARPAASCRAARRPPSSERSSSISPSTAAA